MLISLNLPEYAIAYDLAHIVSYCCIKDQSLHDTLPHHLMYSTLV